METKEGVYVGARFIAPRVGPPVFTHVHGEPAVIKRCYKMSCMLIYGKGGAGGRPQRSRVRIYPARCGFIQHVARPYNDHETAPG
jgi:hypothetical protein